MRVKEIHVEEEAVADGAGIPADVGGDGEVPPAARSRRTVVPEEAVPRLETAVDADGPVGADRELEAQVGRTHAPPKKIGAERRARRVLALNVNHSLRFLHFQQERIDVLRLHNKGILRPSGEGQGAEEKHGNWFQSSMNQRLQRLVIQNTVYFN